MDLTMTSLLFFLMLISPATRARYSYMNGRAMETKSDSGFIPMKGVSPVPTEAPGLNGIAKELRKRDNPQSVCGLIDGDPQNSLTCQPFTSCFVTKNLYVTCCTIPNPDLCFGDSLPTTCFDYDSRQPNPSVGTLTFLCNAATPYCNSITSYGSIPQFFCAGTNYPRSHSFVPIAAYYSSFSATSSMILPSTPPDTPTATAITYNDSNSGPKKKSRLSQAAEGGISAAVGVVTIALLCLLAVYFLRMADVIGQVIEMTRRSLN